MKTIRVNAILMNSIIGHDSCKIMLFHEELLLPGEQVEVKVFSASDDQPTGLFCYRWIIDSTILESTSDGDVIWSLELSAFRPDNSRLGLSRVLKSDNLESF
jgi:hypothetical protein